MVTNELTYKLSGTVRHQGLPVAGVAVVLHEAAHASGGTERTLHSHQSTGSRGEFLFAVGAGTYCLEIIPGGSTRFVRQFIPGIEVSSNTTFNVILSTGFILEGKVCTGSGGVLASCAVTALGIDPSGFRALIPADGPGRFATVLPRGKYLLIPSFCAAESEQAAGAASIPFLTTWHEVVELDSDDKHDLVLSDLVHVRVSVVDRADKPVGSAVALLRPSVDPDNPLAAEIATAVKLDSDSNGQFELMLQPGNYDVVLTPPGSSSLCAMSFKNFALGKEAAPKFELMEGVRLRGKVSFQNAPVGGCLVKARSKDGKLAYSLNADENGKFSFGIPAGSYELTVVPSRGRTRKHAVGAPWTRSVVVGGGDTTVDVELGVAFHVIGCVKDPKGRARDGITVAACLDRNGQLEADDVSNPLAKWTTNDAGRYKLMLAAGKYWLFVAGDPSTAQQVEVKNQQVNCDFTWQGSLRVRFEVAGEAGDPQARCKVSWSPYGVDQPASGSAFTADDGCCELLLKAGVYSFNFEPLPHGNHQSKEIRQLSIGADTVKKIKLGLKPGYDESQLTLDFTPNGTE